MAATRRLRCLPCLLRRPTLSPPYVHRRQPAHPEHSLVAQPIRPTATPFWTPLLSPVAAGGVRSTPAISCEPVPAVSSLRGYEAAPPSMPLVQPRPRCRREARQLHRLVRRHAILGPDRPSNFRPENCWIVARGTLKRTSESKTTFETTKEPSAVIPISSRPATPLTCSSQSAGSLAFGLCFAKKRDFCTRDREKATHRALHTCSSARLTDVVTRNPGCASTMTSPSHESNTYTPDLPAGRPASSGLTTKKGCVRRSLLSATPLLSTECPPNTADKLRSGARGLHQAGAGMRRHCPFLNHAAESFVSFIALVRRRPSTAARLK